MSEINILSKETIENFLEFMAFFEHAKILKEQELIVNRFTAPTYSDASSIRKRLSQTILMRLRDGLSLNVESQRSFDGRLPDDFKINFSVGDIERRRRRVTNLVDYFEMVAKLDFETNFANVFTHRDPNFLGNIKVIHDRAAKEKFIKQVIYRPREDVPEIADNYELLIVKTTNNIPAFSNILGTMNRVGITQVNLGNGCRFVNTDRTPGDYSIHNLSHDAMRNSYFRNMNTSLAILRYYYDELVQDDYIFNEVETANGAYGSNFVANSTMFTDGKIKNFYFCCGDAVSTDKFMTPQRLREAFSRTPESGFASRSSDYLSSLSTTKRYEFMNLLLGTSNVEHVKSKYMFVLSRKEKDEEGNDIIHPFTTNTSNKYSLKLDSNSLLYGDALTTTITNLRSAIQEAQITT